MPRLVHSRQLSRSRRSLAGCCPQYIPLHAEAVSTEQSFRDDRKLEKGYISASEKLSEMTKCIATHRIWMRRIDDNQLSNTIIVTLGGLPSDHAAPIMPDDMRRRDLKRISKPITSAARLSNS